MNIVIKNTAIHQITLPEGEMTVEYEILSPEEWSDERAKLTSLSAELAFCRRVIKQVEGVTVEVNGVIQENPIEALLASPMHFGKLLNEYMVCWGKQILGETSPPLPATGLA